MTRWIASRAAPRSGSRWITRPTGNNLPGTVTLVGRWKASSINQADNTAVATWPALAGSNMTQATSGSQPSYRTNVLNGKPVVRFDGVDDAIATATTMPVTAQPYTIYLVLKANVVSGVKTPASFTGAEFYNNVAARTFWGGSSNRTFGTYTAGTWEVWCAVADGASTLCAVNGTLVGSGSGGTSGNGTISRIGHSNNAGRNWDGDIAEVIYCSGAHDATQRAAVHAYVTAEYGIATV